MEKLEVLIVDLSPYYAQFKLIRELEEKVKKVKKSWVAFYVFAPDQSYVGRIANWLESIRVSRRPDEDMSYSMILDFDKRKFGFSGVVPPNTAYDLYRLLSQNQSIIVLCNNAIDAKYIHDLLTFEDNDLVVYKG